MKKKVVIVSSLICIVFLYAFFLRDILIPLFKMQARGDLEGAKSLLLSKGILGGITVSLVEALQMVVIFIPAEFIQVTSGLSYPFYLALLFCDLGVCLGASIIFILVRTFRFDTETSRQSSEEIRRLSSKTRKNNPQLLMYLLFIMPVVPFGAICYYGSSTKIRYPRYILTVATGVIPSIITSNLIGTSAKAFIMNTLPLWLLVVIIIVLAAILFVILWLFLGKVYFKDYDGTPDSALYYLAVKAARIWRSKRQRLHIDDEKLRGMKAPFLLLCNHESFYDFYYINELMKDYNPAYVINDHLCSLPVLRTISKKTGMIPKKLFYPDVAAFRIGKTIKAGYPVVIFPEGRLSVDGRNNPIAEDASKFYRILGVDLVFAKISGAYYSKPKWRSRFYRSDIYISVERVIPKEELRKMTREEIKACVAHEIAFDESEKTLNTYPQKNRAKGLENVLYRCADCGTLYSTSTKGADLICTSCGSVHHLDESYHFTDEWKSIPLYYERIKEMEKSEIDQTVLRAGVRVKIFPSDKGKTRKERGVCTLTKDAFSYRSGSTEFVIEAKKLTVIAFSCNSEFELYYHDDLYYFYPEENRRQCARWGLLADIILEGLGSSHDESR